ncbi:MAG: acetate--CoA ligase [Minisyncoccales bacterium]
MIKKGELYYPDAAAKKRAWLKSKAVYALAEKNPVKFWENVAKELLWRKKWTKAYTDTPPHIKWFAGAKLNISENCLDRNLAQRKNKVAIIWEPDDSTHPARIITYYDLYRQVNKFANALKKLGIKKGDRVGIYLPMVPEVVVAMLACARIGAIHSVVFSAFSAQALQLRLQDAGAKVLITIDGYYRRGKIIDLKKQADEALIGTAVEKVVVVKRAANVVSWTQARDVWYEEIVRTESDDCVPAVMDAEDPLFILYTSGSTGKPKGALHTCGGYMVSAYASDKWIFDLTDDDIFWSTADIGWVTGHTYSCYGPLLNGATFIQFEGSPDYPNPDRWASVIDKYGVTVFYTAPTAIRMFMKNGTDILKPYKLNTLQVLGSVGEPISEKAWNWYYKEAGKTKCPILDTWWQTETGGIVATSLPGIGPFKPAHTGLPLPGIRIRVLDDSGETCKNGQEGNVVLVSPFAPGLLRGVWQNEQKFIDTYWSQYPGKKIYFSGDLGYRDKNGLLRVVGRSDDMIKVAGHRLTTGELESAACHEPMVAECAVVGVVDEIKGEVPVAFVVPKVQGETAGLKEKVIAAIRSTIGPIATPHEVFVVSDLPKTRSGKIMRRILRKVFTKEELGDLSTLANPESVESIKQTVNPA